MPVDIPAERGESAMNNALPDTCAIILAAGSATRMNGTDKCNAQLGGMTVLERSVSAFAGCDSVAEIIVALPAGREEIGTQRLKELSNGKPLKTVTGGATRQKSVENAVRASDVKYACIAVHDAARPLVRREDIERVIADARVFRAATLGVPVKDTLKIVEGGLIVDTPPRSTLYITQTPQAFLRRTLLEGLDFAREHELDFTDDSQLAEAIGIKVCMSIGSYTNIKITTPEDIAIAGAILGMEGES